MRKTQRSVSSPDRGEAGGEAKDDQMCCGISSKEVTTTARKTESELPGAKLEREKKPEKTPHNINVEKEENGGETTSLNGLDSPIQISSFIM